MRRRLAVLALVALAGPVHPASMCHLTGGWTFADGRVAVTFTRDGKFMVAETSPAEGGGQPGVERGTYTLDPASGALAVSIQRDTNGTFAFSHDAPHTAAVSGNTLVITGSNGPLQFFRVASPTSAIVGSWYHEGGGNTAVITFRADGSYALAQDFAPPASGQPGVEAGTYTWNPQTGAFTSTTTVNTDGEEGLSHHSPPFIFVDRNTMTLSDGSVLTRVAPAPGCAAKDLNGDGKADILWRNPVTGENYVYPMNGTAILPSESYLRSVADSNWYVAAVGDFDGDGKADILWRNAASGENYIYLMNGAAVAAEGYIRTVADASWRVAGVGDFDGDGRDDILWRHAVSGENYLYPMNGLAIAAGEGYLRTVADSRWTIVAIADFDGDGRADIFWRNSATGENYLYPMNGTAIRPGEGYVRTVADLNWRVVGAADFDGDGRADVLWRNGATGENYRYPMNGTAIGAGEGYLRTVPDLYWKVKAVGDYDGDGKADIFWRHASSGQSYVYLMNGSGIVGEGYVRTVADANWQVMPGGAPATSFQVQSPEIQVLAGQQIRYCYFFRTPNAAPLAIRRWTSQMHSAVWNMSLYTSATDRGTPGTVSTSCSFTGDTRLHYSARDANAELVMPPDDGAGNPLGAMLPPNSPAFLEIFISNASASAINVQVTVGAEALPFTTAHTGTGILWTYNSNISIPPGATNDVETQTCPLPAGAKFWRLTTRTFNQGIKAAIKDGATTVFETTDWEHPGAAVFGPPGFRQFASGLTYQCTYNNTGSNASRTITDGDSPSTDERCEAFGYFFPTTQARFCINNLLVP